MRWSPGDRSSNLEDRRGISVGRGLGVGGVVVALILSLVFGRDFLGPASESSSGDVTTSGSAPVVASPEEEHLVDFVSFVLDTVQVTWAQVLPRDGIQYRPAKLVVFRDAAQSACGFAEAATGPFYCPSDERVYVDLGFFQDLKNRFGAPGDFAEAYVLAHEIGHHVQKLSGIEASARNAMQRDPGNANQYSVQLELQADCLAGVWGRYAAQEGILEPGDVEEGIAAAAAVGDDRLQRMSTGYVRPESFTHGTSAQRVAWFKRGLTTGRVRDCDTFGSR